MQINSINNSNINSSPSFGRIYYGAAREVLDKKLSKKQINDFYKIFEENDKNNLVNIILFSRGKNKLEANISANAYQMEEKLLCRSLSQKFFESAFHFVKRCNSAAQEMTKDALGIIEYKKVLNK